MIGTALIEGFIWSALWIIYVYVIVKYFPWQMLHDYPKDIQEAATLKAPTERQNANAGIFSMIGALVSFVSLLLFGVMEFRLERTSFLTIFVFLVVIAMMWNVIDLLVMDWLVICTITPKWVVIEGTDGCKGYKDYLFHLKGFLIGCVYTTIMAVIFAGIDDLILRFLIWNRL